MSNHEPFRLDGLTALVTGGASGIGEAIGRRLTWSGASVIIADVDKARAEDMIAASGAEWVAIRAAPILGRAVDTGGFVSIEVTQEYEA